MFVRELQALCAYFDRTLLRAEPPLGWPPSGASYLACHPPGSRKQAKKSSGEKPPKKHQKKVASLAMLEKSFFNGQKIFRSSPVSAPTNEAGLPRENGLPCLYLVASSSHTSVCGSPCVSPSTAVWRVSRWEKASLNPEMKPGEKEVSLARVPGMGCDAKRRKTFGKRR